MFCYYFWCYTRLCIASDDRAMHSRCTPGRGPPKFDFRKRAKLFLVEKNQNLSQFGVIINFFWWVFNAVLACGSAVVYEEKMTETTVALRCNEHWARWRKLKTSFFTESGELC